MNTLPRSLLLPFSAFTLVSALPGAVVVSDGFESGSDGDNIIALTRAPDVDNTGASVVWSANNNALAPVIIVDGTDKVIEWTKTGGTRAYYIGPFAPMTSGQVSIDFRFMQDGLEGETIKDVFQLEVSPEDPSVAGNQQPAAADRSFAGLELATWATATMIFNGTDAPITYSNGDYTVAPQSADLWVGDVLLRDDNARNGTGDYTYVGVRAFKATALDMIIELDDLVLDDAITFVGPTASVTWAGFEVDENGWADTGAWMGWVFVDSPPWIYNLAVDTWMFLPEASVQATGAWVYAAK